MKIKSLIRRAWSPPEEEIEKRFPEKAAPKERSTHAGKLFRMR